MATGDQIQLLHTIKGAPLSILFALWIENKPTSHIDLVTISGWSKNKVTEACKKLSALGIIQAHSRYGGWMLTLKARQLLLPGIDQPLLESGNGSPKIWDSPEITTITDHPITYINSSSNNKDDGSPKKWDSRYSENLAALLLYGIRRNKRTEALAANENITPVSIHEEAANLQTRRGEIEAGLLITILEDRRDPPPNILKRPAHMRYIDGKYGSIGEY